MRLHSLDWKGRGHYAAICYTHLRGRDLLAHWYQIFSPWKGYCAFVRSFHPHSDYDAHLLSGWKNPGICSLINPSFVLYYNQKEFWIVLFLLRSNLPPFPAISFHVIFYGSLHDPCLHLWLYFIYRKSNDLIKNNIK